MDLFFLILLFSLGSIISLQDIKTEKVSNKLIIAGLLLGVLGYSLQTILALFYKNVNLPVLNVTLINITFSWLVAFCIWYFGFWAAGDAKVFMLFSFLLPLKYYGKENIIPFFPSLVILVNSFLFVIVYISIEAVFKGIKALNFYCVDLLNKRIKAKEEVRRYVSKTISSIPGIFKNVLLFLCIIIVFYLANEYFKAYGFIKILLLITVAASMRILTKISLKKIFIFSLLLFFVVFLTVFVSNKGHFELFLKIYKSTFGLAFIVLALNVVIQCLIRYQDERTIDSQELVSNMILSEKTIQKIGKFTVISGEDFSLVDGITASQAEQIKELGRNNNDFRNIGIVKTFPFVPFLFIGVIATIILKGNLLSKVISFIAQGLK
jgi:prepilin signal peptidase PulO-like enzyme (type II secretory pathway)